MKVDDFMSFKNLKRSRERFLNDPAYCLTPEGATELICRDCPFYKEGEDEGLECGGYKIIKTLLDKGVLRAEEIVNALTE